MGDRTQADALPAGEPGGAAERLAEFEAMYRGGREPFDYEERAVEGWRHERVAALAAGLASGRVLDLGCGLGQITRRLLRHPSGQALDVLALDLSPTAVARARGAVSALNYRAAFIAGSAQALPLRDACIDVVIASDGLVSWHLAAAGRTDALREILRVLEPGGHAVLTEHLRPPQWPAFAAEVRAVGLQADVVVGLHDRPWYWFESWIRAIHGWRIGRALRRSPALAVALTAAGRLLGSRGCHHVLVVARRPGGA